VPCTLIVTLDSNGVAREKCCLETILDGKHKIAFFKFTFHILIKIGQPIDLWNTTLVLCVYGQFFLNQVPIGQLSSLMHTANQLRLSYVR